MRELQLKRKLRLIYREDANLSLAARAFLKVAEAVTSNARDATDSNARTRTKYVKPDLTIVTSVSKEKRQLAIDPPFD